MVFDVQQPSAPSPCYVILQDQLKSIPDILDPSSGCWAVHTVRDDSVNWATPSRRLVTLTWRPCDYTGEGFRAELAQPWSVPKIADVKRNPWGIGDDRTFSSVNYHWSFSLSDEGGLLGDDVSGIFVAQWHSERPAPSDGSPVIGLLYEKGTGLKPGQAFLTLTMKVLGRTGQCLSTDEAVSNQHGNEIICFKRLARIAVEQGVFHKVDVGIEWDLPGKMGGASVRVDGAPMQGIAPYNPDADGRYLVPNKQAESPNYFNFGMYVQSRLKRPYQQFRAEHPDTVEAVPSFCRSDKSLLLKLKDFSFDAPVGMKQDAGVPRG
jgi:hypothetical protein